MVVCRAFFADMVLTLILDLDFFLIFLCSTYLRFGMHHSRAMLIIRRIPSIHVVMYSSMDSRMTVLFGGKYEVQPNFTSPSFAFGSSSIVRP